MSRLLVVLMTVALLSSCVFEQGLDLGDKPKPEPADAWTGKAEAQLVAERGAPNRTYTLTDGRRALTYDSWNGSPAGFCVRTFIVKGRIVQSSSKRGKRCS
jgi:hypothetical protein